MGTQVFAAVTAPHFSAEQILNARNVFAAPVGVELCFHGLVQIDGRLVATLSVQHSATIARGTLPRGVWVVVATDGISQIVKKVIL